MKDVLKWCPSNIVKPAVYDIRHCTSQHAFTLYFHSHLFCFSFYDFRRWQRSKWRGTRLQSCIVIIRHFSTTRKVSCSINTVPARVRCLEHTLLPKILGTQSFWKMDGRRGSKEQNRFWSWCRESRLRGEWENIYRLLHSDAKRITNFQNFYRFREQWISNVQFIIR